MSGVPLDRAFREAGGTVIAALAARFRDLDVAEDAYSEACLRAAETWPRDGTPDDPAAWLYRVAERRALDGYRRRRVRRTARPEPPTPEPTAEELMADDARLIPDERLRLIFVCCHPAVAVEARAALTLRLVCGLTTTEIARAFLVAEPTLAQRLTRAKRKIADAGVPFDVPPPSAWAERLDAVLSTIEVAYSKAHEDAAGTGPHAGYRTEMLRLTAVLAGMLPFEPDVLALAALVRYAEARRPARVGPDGLMIPLSEQDSRRWDRELIADGDAYLKRALARESDSSRVSQATLHGVWCARQPGDPPPWPQVLAVYDTLLATRDDPVVRLNRAVALAEVESPEAALNEIDTMDRGTIAAYLPYHAVRADLLRRLGRPAEARAAYDSAIALAPGEAERRWLAGRRDSLDAPA